MPHSLTRIYSVVRILRLKQSGKLFFDHILRGNTVWTQSQGAVTTSLGVELGV
jgi:hypothetical protein